ncbi:aromatic-L-amino-acid decarboxylase [Thelephora ganbajun]|uniref:Aromatic-L-amino-acid decarboxylase n=1 Tax=Thelephora ganbajun TaxID=370292 RepID=A0ACB6ZG50_THEGA|nr:aromatic-L-amino-acid decarboxylase [Thelephora ganbajun]
MVIHTLIRLITFFPYHGHRTVSRTFFFSVALAFFDGFPDFRFRKAGYQAIDRICDYYYSLQNKPVKSNVKPGYLREALPVAPPTKGESIEDIANDYQDIIMPGLTHWQHPSFFAYYPTASTFEGIIGDLYATTALNPGFNWICSPACTELENVVMDWAAQLFGLSEDFYNTTQVGGGVIQSTASDSALVAIVTARSRYQRLHPDVPIDKLVVYVTTQTHSLGLKAGLILGLPVYAIPVRAEDDYGLRGHGLREVIERDKAEGKHPFVIVGTVGTTSSGAIDNIDEIAEALRDHPDIWLHIDAAWLGAAFSCPQYRARCHLPTINKVADSICINFHKARAGPFSSTSWGLVNFDCSAFWVRDRKNLTEALDITPPFLRSTEGDAGIVVDYRNWGLTLGRRFRSLKVWFVLRSFGVEGFQAYIRKCISLGEIFAESVRNHPELLELVTPPSFSLSVFRIAPGAVPGLPAHELNELNELYYRRLNERNELMLTQTELNGVHCVRFVVGVQRTERIHVEAAFGICLETAKLVTREFTGSRSY